MKNIIISSILLMSTSLNVCGSEKIDNELNKFNPQEYLNVYYGLKEEAKKLELDPIEYATYHFKNFKNPYIFEVPVDFIPENYLKKYSGLKEEAENRQMNPIAYAKFHYSLYKNNYEYKNDITEELKNENISEKLNKEFQKKWEEKFVEDNPMEGTNPTPKSKVIRRTLDAYNKDNEVHKLGLYYGHDGDASFGFCGKLISGNKFNLNGIEVSNKMDWFTVDQCWSECDPDAVLDISNNDHMAYFPSDWADVIFSDWLKPSNEVVLEAVRILKSGGQFIFRPGAGTGWPRRDFYSEEVQISDDGLSGCIGSKGDVEKFRKIALEKVQKYFGELGFSSAELTENERSFLFILTKK